MRFTHPDMFQRAVPYTTRTVFHREEAEVADYRIIDEEQFNVWSTADRFMFVEFVEEHLLDSQANHK